MRLVYYPDNGFVGARVLPCTYHAIGRFKDPLERMRHKLSECDEYASLSSKFVLYYTDTAATQWQQCWLPSYQMRRRPYDAI